MLCTYIMCDILATSTTSSWEVLQFQIREHAFIRYQVFFLDLSSSIVVLAPVCLLPRLCFDVCFLSPSPSRQLGQLKQQMHNLGHGRRQNIFFLDENPGPVSFCIHLHIGSILVQCARLHSVYNVMSLPGYRETNKPRNQFVKQFLFDPAYLFSSGNVTKLGQINDGRRETGN